MKTTFYQVWNVFLKTFLKAIKWIKIISILTYTFILIWCRIRFKRTFFWQELYEYELLTFLQHKISSDLYTILILSTNVIKIRKILKLKFLWRNRLGDFFFPIFFHNGNILWETSQVKHINLLKKKKKKKIN